MTSERSEPLFISDSEGLPVPTEAWWNLTEEEQRAWVAANDPLSESDDAE